MLAFICLFIYFILFLLSLYLRSFADFTENNYCIVAHFRIAPLIVGNIDLTHLTIESTVVVVLLLLNVNLQCLFLFLAF